MRRLLVFGLVAAAAAACSSGSSDAQGGFPALTDTGSAGTAADVGAPPPNESPDAADVALPPDSGTGPVAADVSGAADVDVAQAADVPIAGGDTASVQDVSTDVAMADAPDVSTAVDAVEDVAATPDAGAPPPDAGPSPDVGPPPEPDVQEPPACQSDDDCVFLVPLQCCPGPPTTCPPIPQVGTKGDLQEALDWLEAHCDPTQSCPQYSPPSCGECIKVVEPRAVCGDDGACHLVLDVDCDALCQAMALPDGATCPVPNVDSPEYFNPVQASNCGCP